MHRAGAALTQLSRCHLASALLPTCSAAVHSNFASTGIHSAHGCSSVGALPAFPTTPTLPACARPRNHHYGRPFATATSPSANPTSTTSSPAPTTHHRNPDPSSPIPLLHLAPDDTRPPERLSRDLGRACAHGDVPRVTQLLDQLLTDSHGDPVRRRQLLMSRTVSGGTPLHAVAAKGHVEVVRLLLGAGADANAAAERDGCAVERPAKTKKEPSPPPPFKVPDGWVLVPLELEEPDDWYQGETPLHAACASGHAEVVEQLLAAGADIDGLSPTRGPPLAVAAANDHGPVVRTLLEAGANVNAVRPSDGATPLVVAITEGMDRTVPYMLIDAGVDLEIADKEGYTPLLSAAVRSEDEDLVLALRAAGAKRLRDSVAAEASKKWLVQHCVWDWKVLPIEALMLAGGDPDGEHRGLTPLVVASYRGDAHLARALLEEGADVNRRVGPNGLTALQCACAQGHQEVAEVLLKFGAGVGLGREVGMELLEHVCKQGHLGLVRLLLGVVPDPWVVDDGDDVSRLAKAWYWGRVGVVLELLEHVCKQGNLGLVRLLLAVVPDPWVVDEDDVSLLAKACYWGRAGVVLELLSYWGKNRIFR